VANERYLLGKNCTFSIEGQLLKSVRDVGVRRVVTEQDATGFNHEFGSTVVVRRSWEIDVEVQKPDEIKKFLEAENKRGIVTVETANGMRSVSADFMVCDSDASEPLNDSVRARFTLRQWQHGKMET
jgi:hypothetical protein